MLTAMLVAAASAIGIISIIDVEWAAPANTALLIILTAVNAWQARKERQLERKLSNLHATAGKKLADIHQIVSDDPRNGLKTREGDEHVD